MTDHVRTTYRNHGRMTWGLVIAVVIAISAVLVPLGAAKPPSSDIKKYDVCLQNAETALPACQSPWGQNSVLPGGTTAHVRLDLTNQPGSNQPFGSANINAPSQLPIVPSSVVSSLGAGTLGSITASQIQLRNLNLAPNSSMTVTFDVTTPCSGTNLPWSVPAKQSNTFLGTGNDFSLINATGLKTNIEPCLELRFVNQPAKTVVGATITDADYSNGDPISVGLYSGGQSLVSCPASVGDVTIAKDPSDGDLSGNVAALTGSPCVATFSSLAISDVSSLPQEYTLTASGPGSLDPESDPFQIIDGTNCVGEDPCIVDPVNVGNTRSSGRATGGEFVFVAFEQLDLDYIPEGCAGFKSVGADKLYIAEQRSALSGQELFVTYGVRKSQIQKKYGNNSGQQFIPLCVGAKRLALVGDDDPRTQAVDCDQDYNGISQEDTGWWGKQLDADGKFTGRLAKAVCDGGEDGTGFFFAIVGSFQDYTNSDACKVIDPATSPTVTEWTTDTTYRYFTSRWPSSSATPPAKSTDASCPDTSATPAFANIPWDGVKFG